MKNLTATALLLAASLIPAMTASAQDHSAKANVPFSFTVGTSTVPAGTYRISSEGNSPAIINLSNREKNVHLLTMARPEDRPNGDTNILVFHVYAGQYFLTDVRSSASALYIHFPTSSAEKRAKARMQEAGLFANDPVLIALN